MPLGAMWRELGPTFHGVMAPLYKAAGAECPTPDAWGGFAESWGRVVDYYIPSLNATPWPQAIAATGAVSLPLFLAWDARRREAAAQAEREATKAPTRDEVPAAA